MRHIVIATPAKSGLDEYYLDGFVKTLTNPPAGIKISHAVMSGTLVSFARNELVHYARRIGAREILFIDSDMQWNETHFARMLSHVDLDIVAGLYCKRRPGKPYWLMTEKEGCEIDPVTGLLEVEDAPTGFMKIRLDTVMPAIEKKFPHLQFYVHENNDDRKKTSWEFFPMGVVGPRCPAARMERVKQILKDNDPLDLPGGHLSGFQLHKAIHAACYDEQDPAWLLGEDYGFCSLARQCGFKLYVDMGMPIVPHVGQIPFPIMAEMVGIDDSDGVVIKEDK